LIFKIPRFLFYAVRHRFWALCPSRPNRDVRPFCEEMRANYERMRVSCEIMRVKREGIRGTYEGMRGGRPNVCTEGSRYFTSSAIY